MRMVIVQSLWGDHGVVLTMRMVIVQSLWGDHGGRGWVTMGMVEPVGMVITNSHLHAPMGLIILFLQVLRGDWKLEDRESERAGG
jgi:hypothetical protein